MKSEESRHDNLITEIIGLLKESSLDEEYLTFIKKLIKSYIKLKNQHLL